MCTTVLNGREKKKLDILDHSPSVREKVPLLGSKIKDANFRKSNNRHFPGFGMEKIGYWIFQRQKSKKKKIDLAYRPVKKKNLQLLFFSSLLKQLVCSKEMGKSAWPIAHIALPVGGCSSEGEYQNV